MPRFFLQRSLRSLFCQRFLQTPLITSTRPNVMGDGQADINDIYAFRNPNNSVNGNNSVFVLTVNSSAADSMGANASTTDFDPLVNYDIQIDNTGDSVTDITYRTTFSANLAGGQNYTLSRIDAGGTALHLVASRVLSERIQLLHHRHRTSHGRCF